jgi:hypothetical protein
MPRAGWGVAYFPGGKARVVREYGDAHNSVHYDETSHMASSNPDARVLLAQLCAARPRGLANHGEGLAPFSGRDAAGRDWLLAFDGSAGANGKTGEPQGADPEPGPSPGRVLSALMGNLGGPSGAGGVRAAIKSAMDAVAGDLGRGHLNLALTDGAAVYIARHADREADWNALWYVRLPRATIVCSEALPTIDQKWERLGNRKLLVFDPAQNLETLDI